MLSIAKDHVTNLIEKVETTNPTVVVQGIEIDFSVAANNLGANETIRIMKQPSGTRHSKLFLAVRTVEGGTATIDIGGSVDKDALVDGANANASTLSVVHPAVDVVDTDTWITLTAINALDAAKIYVECEFTFAAVESV